MTSAASRICTVCGENKEETCFTGQRSKIGTGLCKSCKSTRDRSYRARNADKQKLWWQAYKLKNPEELRQRSRLSVSVHRFGFDRDDFIKGSSTCEHCGVSQAAFFGKNNFSLDIHHKDNCGRKAQRLGLKPNNDFSNLQILCRSCHRAEDNRKFGYYEGRGEKIWATRRANQRQTI